MHNNFSSEIVVRVLQGIQTEEEMRVFLKWYRHSLENKKLFFQLKHLYELREGGLMPDEKEVEASWKRLQGKLDKHPAGSLSSVRAAGNKRGFFSWVYISAAAIAVLLVVLSVRILHQPSQVEWKEVRTGPAGEPRSIFLPDGSHVRLNASSLLRFPEKFKKGPREVYLDGEAYFDVVEDKHNVFVVHTDKQQINVLGTEFNVLGYASDPYTVTTLVTGKVSLGIYDHNNELKEEIVMRPNQQVYFDKELHRTLLADVNSQEATSWLRGVYSFRDAPLEEIVRRLEKVHGVNFVILEEALREEAYTGKFFADQTLDETVDVLNFKGRFHFQSKEDTIFIREKK